MAAQNKIQISHKRWGQLVELAERIGEDYSDSKGRTDPLEILDDHDLTVSFNDYGDCFDGMLHFEAGRFHVYCNLKRCTAPKHVRARFTLSHELGHFFIPEHHHALRSGLTPFHPSFCSEPSPEHYVEAEADLFASRLLMPEGRFSAAVRRHGVELDGIRSVANDMGTSLQATLIRFKDSMTVPCAFVWWRDGAKPWFGVSRMLYAHGIKSLSPLRENLAPGCATALALNAGAQSNPEVFRRESVASVWFRDIGQGTLRDIQLSEEAMATPYGTVTWLACQPSALTAIPSIIKDGDGISTLD